jgi:hypothetical protein
VFRIARNNESALPEFVTTAEQFRSIVTSRDVNVPIAGVPWPLYKVLALTAGFAVLIIVGIVTMSAAPAVLAGASVGTTVWLVLGFVSRSRR